MGGNTVQVSLCDLCGTTAARVLYGDLRDTALGGDGVFAMVQCARCGLVRLDPRPDASRLAEHYPHEYVPYQKSNRLIRMLKRHQWARMEAILRRSAGGIGSVFEVGCARGEFLEFLKSRGWRVAGLEMDPASAEAARAAGVDVRAGTFESAEFAADERFDCVVLSYVLEHLPSPLAALTKIHGILREGGVAVISIPNYESWDRRAFGRFWHGFDVPRHLHIFSDMTLRAYGAKTGFSTEHVRYGTVPNDWIGGMSRIARERGKTRLAGFLTYKNPLLAALCFPLSLAAAALGASSRFTFFLRKRSVISGV